MKLFRNRPAHRTIVFLPLLLVCIGRIHPASAQWGSQQPQQQPSGGSNQPGQSQWQTGQQLPGQGVVAHPQMNPQDGYYVLTYPQGSNGNHQYPKPQGGGGSGQGQGGVMGPGSGSQTTVDDKQPECTNQPRITGGLNAQWNDAPFMVSLREIRNDQYANFGLGHFCGGVLISPYFVLTAASCLVNRQPQDVGVVVGTLNRRKDKFHATQLLFPEKFVTHPSYSFETTDQDIGLILLKQAVHFEKHVKSASLAWQDPRSGTECTIFGWGQTSRNQQYLMDCLQMAKVKVQNLEECQRHFQQRNIKIPHMSFCAGYYGGGSDACLGDIGGPLTCDDVLYGIINNRIGCGEADVGKVYTNVYSFRNWIKYTIDSLKKEYKGLYPADAFDSAMKKESRGHKKKSVRGGANGNRISLGLIAAAGLLLMFV